MNKVGLSVCYDTKNFGSQLQVLATINQIEKLGYDTEIIRYKKKISLSLIMQNMPRLFNGQYINGLIKSNKKNKLLSKYPEIVDNIKIRNNRFTKFANDNFINVSNFYYGWHSLKNAAKKNYDMFLCGSDQLWLPSNLESHFYTLEYAPNEKPKISYATSFGVGEIPWYQKNRTKKYLNRLNHISTRELKGAEIINDLTGRDVQVVCDPTLLLTKEEWDKLIPNHTVVNEKYIFCYFLGENENHRLQAQKLANQFNLKIVTIPFLDNYVEIDRSFGDYSLYDIDTNDFVNLIRNAEFVLTDSFHGTIFSILNNKKFITFNRFDSKSKNSRNSRIDSLFKVLNIQERRYNSKLELSEQIIKDIDYGTVINNVESLRNDSINYLTNALAASE